MHVFDQEAINQLFDLPTTFKRDTPIFNQLLLSFASALALFTEAASATMDQTAYANAVAGWIDVWGDLAGILRRSGESDEIFSARLPAMLLAARDSLSAIKIWLQTVEGVAGIVAEDFPPAHYTVSVPATVSTAQLKEIIKDLAYVRPAGVPFNFSSGTGGTYLNTVDYYGVTKWSQPIRTFPGGQIIMIQEPPTEVSLLEPPYFGGGRVTGAYFSKGLNPGKTFLGTINYYGGKPALGTLMIPGPMVPLEAYGTWPWQGGRVTGSYFASKKQITGVVIPASTDNQVSALPDLLFTDPTVNPSV